TLTNSEICFFVISFKLNFLMLEDIGTTIDMLCLKKRRTYSFTQGACAALPRRSGKDNNRYEGSLNMAITTLPRKNRSREERPSRMVLTVTEDTPADMLAGSMELLVQLPRDHHLHTQKVTVLRSTPMMDLLVQIATAHKLTASSYTLQAIGERGLVLPHHPNTPIGALDALQVKLLPKQGTCAPRKTKQANQPFETTFRLQVHLPRNQLYVSRVSPKMNLGEILDEVCREKNLDRSKYELRHPGNLEEILDLSLSLQDYHLQEVTLYAKQTRNLGPTLSTQDIMALQRQEERRRQQTKQSVFGFMFKKSKENSLSTDSLGGRSVSPARSDETARSASPLQPPTRPQRKRRPAPKPPSDASTLRDVVGDSSKDKMMINHSRNSSDSSGYHEASVLSDNPDSAARLPETLPRRSKAPGTSDNPRKLAQTSQSSKSLGNLAATSETLSRGISSTSLSSTGLRKKRAAPPPPAPRPLSSAISTQALERIVDSEESLTSDMDPSKPPSDIGVPLKASSDIDCPKANSDIGVSTQSTRQLDYKSNPEVATCESDGNVQQNGTAETSVAAYSSSDSVNSKLAKANVEVPAPITTAPRVKQARVAAKRGKLTRNASGSNTSIGSLQNPSGGPHQVGEGRLSTTDCYTNSIVSSENKEFYNALGQYAESNLSPPPLSTLQIFAISTSPLDIQMAPLDSMPSNVDELPLLPIVNHIENKLEKRKLSILEPPPPDLAPKRSKVAPVLIPRRASSIESDHDLARESPEHVSEARCTSIDENTISLDQDGLITRIEHEKAHSKMRNDCAPGNEDQISQKEKMSKPIDDAAIEYDTSLESRQDSNDETENTSELHSNSIELTRVHSEEASKDKSLNDDEFNHEKIMPDIVNDVENQKSLNSSQRSGNEGELHVDSKEPQLSECKDIPEERKNNSPELDREIKSKTIDSLDENENQPRDTSLSNDPSSNENTMKLDCVTEPRNEQLKLPHRSTCQRPPRVPRRATPSTYRTEENAEEEAVKRTHSRDVTNDAVVKNSGERDRETCTVISTIPKCEHLDRAVKENSSSSSVKRGVASMDHHEFDRQISRAAESVNKLHEKLEDQIEEASSEHAKSAKRPKARTKVRSQSKSDDFEVDSLKRQRRYLTSPAENIAHALNLNLPVRNSISSSVAGKEWEQSTAGHCANGDTRDADVDKRESHGGLVTGKTGDVCLTNVLFCSHMPAANQDVPSETDILLQKVSDTLSSVLPAASSPVPEPLSSSKTNHATATVQTNVADVPDSSAAKLETVGTKNDSSEMHRSCIDFPVENTLSASTPNMTATGSQQDTSDYVSAMEDLSISDWEYQLPAPPSAFRDSHSPIFNDYDTITLGSVDAFKEQLIDPVSEPVDDGKNIESAKNPSNDSEASNPKSSNRKVLDLESEAEIDIKRTANKPVAKQPSVVSHKSETNPDLRKEIISELENKIETGTLAQTISKDFDRRNMDNLSTPNVAPVDNTLSNFTITTYTKQKSVDIFEEAEEAAARNSEERFIKTFATLSRNNGGASNYDKQSVTKNAYLSNGMMPYDKKVATSKLEELSDVCKTEPKIRDQDEPSHKRQSFTAANEKINIQRSKSYISMSSNARYQTEVQGIGERKYEVQVEPEAAGMKKATSITGLNVDVLAGNGKFSQWRDNILKQQEEPTKEKQLQSLQVIWN
ncbi:hypothetical protein DMN91_004475, partial [Ooceraea biroi]